MIGGIEVFLPFAQEEAEGSVADDTTTAGEQSAMTVRKKKSWSRLWELPQVSR
jgi:hypothetical protein